MNAIDKKKRILNGEVSRSVVYQIISVLTSDLRWEIDLL